MSDGWRESIAKCEDREEARKKFHEWCEAMASVYDAIELAGRQNDVARLHIKTDGNHFARDLPECYGEGTNPIRVIDVNAFDENRVEIEVLLARLTTKNNADIEETDE